MLKILKIFLLDLFFPKKCLGCGRNGIYICENCLNKIEIARNNQCPFCDRPVPESLICQPCQKNYYLSRLIWAVHYYNPLVQKLIKIFKYHCVKDLAHPLAQLLIKSLENNLELEIRNLGFLIVPIPLHKRKLRERDFNQAELLAQEVAEYFSLPLETKILARKKYTPQQAKTKNHRKRKEMLKNAFEISPEFVKKCVSENQNLLRDKIVILVDDVFTAGATLSEAAKVLKQGGAKEVWGLVVAKG
jgi:ComF family protein